MSFEYIIRESLTNGDPTRIPPPITPINLHNYPNKLIILAIVSGPGKPTGSGTRPSR